jgi:hypothetical protein
VGVVGGPLADVGGERGEGVSVRAGLAGGPVPVEVDPDRLAVVAEVPGAEIDIVDLIDFTDRGSPKMAFDLR